MKHNRILTSFLLLQELLPIVYMFELPITGTLCPLPDVNSAEIQKLQQQYNISINFRQRPRMYVSTVIVRGSVYNADAVKEGIAKLMELLTGNSTVILNVYDLITVETAYIDS